MVKEYQILILSIIEHIKDKDYSWSWFRELSNIYNKEYKPDDYKELIIKLIEDVKKNDYSWFLEYNKLKRKEKLNKIYESISN